VVDVFVSEMGRVCLHDYGGLLSHRRQFFSGYGRGATSKLRSQLDIGSAKGTREGG